VTPDCAGFRGRVEGYLADALGRAERTEFRAHLRACPDCRDIALQQDSTLIFGALPAALPGDRDAGQEALSILENVRGAIAIRQASAKLSPGRSRRPGRRYGAAGGLAACVAALLFFNSSSLRRSEARRPARPLAAESGRRAPAPAISTPEPLAPASATIYEWNPGAASDAEPKIVWIVDRSFDI
jgi:putative zinc finger protein